MMGKRFILAIILSMLVIMVWSRLFPFQRPIPIPSKEPLSPVVEEGPGLKERPPEAPRLPEGARDIVVETELFRIVFTTSGGRIKSCRLKRYEEIGIRSRDIEKEVRRAREEYERAILQQLLVHSEMRSRRLNQLKEVLERAEEEGRYGEAEAITRELLAERGVELVSIEAGLWEEYPLTIRLEDEEKSQALNLALYEPDKERLLLGGKEETLVFTSPIIEGLRVIKRFTFSPETYAIGVELAIKDEVLGAPPEGWFMVEYGPGIGLPEISGMRRYGYRGPATLIHAEPQDMLIKERYGRAEGKRALSRVHPGQVLWTAIESKYFTVALIPQGPVQAAVVEKDEYGAQKVGLKAPFGGTSLHRFTLYLGPKEERRLKDLGVGLERVVEYGFFGPIARAIAAILGFFYGWIHNYGWAIVLLALSIKIAFYPLTHRSLEAMQRMQEDMKRLQPELEDLRRKYGSNPRKLQKEQMELYRRRGVNPMAGCRGGCFPMLLQLPVFFALYAVLYNSIELRGAGFLGWIEDLSSKDPYYILPVLMGISMLVQQKLAGPGAAAGTQQQAMMVWMMPIMFTWIFATLPSGVVLYWFVFNLFTGIEQVLIKKKG